MMLKMFVKCDILVKGKVQGDTFVTLSTSKNFKGGFNMLFVTKEMKIQLANARKVAGIADIVNNDKLSTYTKACRLYQHWCTFGDETSKNIFEMMRGSAALRDGWYKELEENSKKQDNGTYVRYKKSYLEFYKIMREDFGPPIEEG